MYVEYAIVLMPLLLLTEWLWGKFKNKPLFNFNDTIANVCCGVMERTMDIFWSVLMYAMLVYIYDHYALFHIPFNVLTWIGFFIFTDFLFYWFHRLSHEINVFWGAHETHHQSEEFNYTVPFRLSGLAAIVRFLFWIPLIIVGCDPNLALSIIVLHGLYQFFTHTRMINKMGFLEKILVTPSSHRVHHACNPQYIDKNYGGVLIIWDRLFGTYCPEGEEAIYGTIQPFRSYNPYWAYVHYWVESFQKVRHLRRFSDKVKFFFTRPGYVPEELKPYTSEYNPEMVYNREKFNIPLPKAMKYYIAIQSIIAVSFVGLLVLLKNMFDWPDRFLIAVLIGISTYCIGKLLERWERIGWWEYFRLILIPLIVLAVFADTPHATMATAIASGLCVFFALWFKMMHKKRVPANAQ